MICFRHAISKGKHVAQCCKSYLVQMLLAPAMCSDSQMGRKLFKMIILSPMSLSSLTIFVHRPWLMISSQLNIHPDFTNELLNLASVHSNLYIMESCADPTRVNIRCHQNIPYNYPNVLKVSFFILLSSFGVRLFNQK